MNVHKTIAKNTISNWIGYAVNLLVAFFLSPFVVHSLGDTSYGIWSLIVSLTGYYGILDLGIRSAVSQYITRYHSQNQTDELNRNFSTAFFVLLIIGFLFLLITLLLALWLPYWLRIEQGSIWAIRVAMIIMGSNIAIGFPLIIYSSALTSLQRFELSNGIGIVSKFVNLILVIYILKSGFGLIGLSIVTSISNFVTWFLSIYFARRILPSLRLRTTDVNSRSLKELGGYGFYTFIMNISDKVINYTDTIVIGLFMPAAAITYYSIAWVMPNYLLSLVGGFTLALTPLSISYDAKNDKKGLQSLLIQGSKVSAIIAFPISFFLLIWGSDFLHLWMGPEYVSGRIYTSSGQVLSILILSLLPSYILSTAKQILFGLRRLRVPTFLTVIEAITNLSLSLILVQKIGLLGVALGTLIPKVVFTALFLPIYVCRLINVPFISFLIRGFLRPFVSALIFVGSYWSLELLFPELTWKDMILRSFFSALFFSFAVFYLCIPLELRLRLFKSVKFIYRGTFSRSHQF